MIFFEKKLIVLVGKLGAVLRLQPRRQGDPLRDRKIDPADTQVLSLHRSMSTRYAWGDSRLLQFGGPESRPRDTHRYITSLWLSTTATWPGATTASTALVSRLLVSTLSKLTDWRFGEEKPCLQIGAVAWFQTANSSGSTQPLSGPRHLPLRLPSGFIGNPAVQQQRPAHCCILARPTSEHRHLSWTHRISGGLGLSTLVACYRPLR